MWNKRLMAVAALLLLAASFPVLAQPRPNTTALPVKQIMLFSSGVGYFQREGPVDGQARIDLQFHMDDINDLLKSLILEDSGKGNITVNYDNRSPIEHTLKSFALDLTRNPTMADLLTQARGEGVQIVTTVDSVAVNGGVGQAETISGTIVGVEMQRKFVKDQMIEGAQLNLLTQDGLRGIPLAQVQKVRFTKASLDQEFRKALEVLATGHDKQKKTVSLNFGGSGQRDVKVGYVTESPIWKTSYRLAVKDDKVYLQGWAIVENTSDEDWNNVQLGLVSSRPISFRMDLYEPLFVPRPLVEPELFASLRPQVYSGDMDKLNMPRMAPGAPGDGKGRGGEAKEAMKKAREESGIAAFAGGQGALRDLQQKADQARANNMNFHKDVASAAVATDLGDFFEYVIRNPVSLPRQKSALLPIINDEVKGQKVSIYNERVHNKFPLRGLQFENSTPLHLAQGPLTVFEGNTYAGDARISDLQPGEKRLISYAVDLGVEVEPKQSDVDNLLKIKIVKGVVYQDFERKEIKTYTIKNRAKEERTLLIEHPYRSNFNLVKPEKSSERTREVYRFEVKAETGKPVDLVVEERQPRQTTVSLSNSNSDEVRFFIRSNAASEAVKDALAKAMALKVKVDDKQIEINREAQLLQEIEQDQVRMRENMKALPQTAEVYKVYLKKFLDQEKSIETKRDTLKKMREDFDSQRRSYESFLANLNVE